ncbi:MAG: phosphopentomutase [Lactobacillales bacterium]|nr:phosphopentomutase [Lactobacillales bacterium]
MFKRIFLIVLDSVGIGAAHDAEKFDDVGTNTFMHAVESTNLEFPNLRKLGFFNLANNEKNETISIYTKGIEVSNGKDTLTGHLEMMGVITSKPFKTFLNGFPKELIDEIEKLSGRKVIGNCVASGTEIIKELGDRQIETGELIIYTSADSVLQIAAHEEVIPLDELYDICKKVRELTLKDEWKVGRIIARPYIGTNGNFERTPNRHDYALDPAHETVLDILKNNNYDVISIGKIADVFNNCGITKSIKTKDNLDGINKILEEMDNNFKGLCFANLNDYDSKYGHRRNPIGYAEALKEFDNYVPNIIEKLNDDDLLIITADHGNDPTYKGTDHTRENIPVVFYHNNIKESKKIADLESFAKIGYTVLENFNLDKNKGILEEIK